MFLVKSIFVSVNADKVFSRNVQQVALYSAWPRPSVRSETVSVVFVLAGAE